MLAVKRRHVVLALLCALGVILYMDRVCISIALPAMQRDLEIAPELLGWISLAFSLSYGLFEIPSGHLGDRVGARRTLGRITLWWSAFTALTGAAFGFASLLVTRFMFGAGEAGAWPNTSSVISKWFPSASRARAMGMFGAATALGGALSPLIVIPLQHAVGWRTSFVLFGFVGVVWAAVWLMWFRDTPAELGVSPEELAELDAIPPVPARGLRWSIALRDPSIWGLAAMAFADIYVAFFGLFWMPTFLTKGRAFTDSELKWSAAMWIGSVIGNAAGGAISDALVVRIGRAAGRRVVGVTGMLIVAIALVVIAQTDSKVVAIVGLAVCGLAWGAIQVNAFAACIDVGGSHVGTVAGIMNTAAQLGGGLSAVAFGYIVKATDYDVPLLVMAGVSAAGALAWRWIDASRPIAA